MHTCTRASSLPSPPCPRAAPLDRQLLVAGLHAFAHLSQAITLALLLELAVETCIRWVTVSGWRVSGSARWRWRDQGILSFGITAPPTVP